MMMDDVDQRVSQIHIGHGPEMRGFILNQRVKIDKTDANPALLLPSLPSCMSFWFEINGVVFLSTMK